MHRLAILICLIGTIARGAEPPDWYGHIPAKQRAALQAVRHAVVNPALIAGAGAHGWQEPVSAPYSAPYAAPQFDLSTIGAANLTIAQHNGQRAIVRRILWAYRQPEVYKPLTGRGLVRCESHGCKHMRNEAR